MPTPPSASAAPAAAPPAPTTVVVELGDRAYPIHIGAGLLDRGDLLAPHVGRRALVVTNETVGPLYLDRLTAALAAHGVDVQAVVLPDGEQYKTVETLMQVWDAALQGRHGRDTTFVALGGGVVGDMTGFAAAAYQRGVAFVQVPTTVMATVDSSVGGKTGVNHPLGKNMVGAFHQPHAVLIDVATLDTLPDRELRSGLSEVGRRGSGWVGVRGWWVDERRVRPTARPDPEPCAATPLPPTACPLPRPGCQVWSHPGRRPV